MEAITVGERADRRPAPGAAAPAPNLAALFDTRTRLADDELLAVVAWVQAETRQRAAAWGAAAAHLARVQLLLTDAAVAASAAVRFSLLSVAHQRLADDLDELRRDLA